MKPNLYNLQGSELLPKERDDAELVKLHGDHRAYWYNQAVDQINKLGVELDENAMASLIPIGYRTSDNVQMFRVFIGIVCANQSKIIKIVRVDG